MSEFVKAKSPIACYGPPMMETIQSRRIVLARRPVGSPALEDFREEPVAVEPPRDGEVRIRVRYLSIDPYMRGRISDRRSYARPVALGEVMLGEGVGEIVDSADPRYQPGEIVLGPFGWQCHAVARGDHVQRVEARPISLALGLLGMPGLTAYFGLTEIGAPRPGDTVVVSSAAGAVGSAVCQLARLAGCRVVGIAGRKDKIDYLREELGVDDALDYREIGDARALREALGEACPDGVNIYFDNVGGWITDAVVSRLAVGGRVVVCGQISLYNESKPPPGPRWLSHLIVARARVEGFLITDYRRRYAEGRARLAALAAAGKLSSREDIRQGLSAAPAALIGLLSGDKLGKLLVQLGD